VHIGFQEALLLFGLALLLFGASRIPEIFKGFGEGIREFKKAVKDKDEDHG
jgi:sec-independent protein translocase protein TatA